MDYTVPGILQARILECSGKYYISLLQGIVPTQGYEPRSPTLQTDSLPVEPQGSPRILVWVAYTSPGVGSLSFLQQIFLTQESNWGLLQCRQILYQVS